MCRRTRMTDTVPTPEEVNGDFSMSGVTIYDPNTTVTNPNYNPSLPVTAQNPQFTRQPFPDNKIPLDRMSSVAVDDAEAIYSAAEPDDGHGRWDDDDGSADGGGFG